MNIKTKYNIGDRVWIVYEHQGEVSLYDTIIKEACFNDEGLYYMTEEYNDYKEERIIPYNEKEKLLERIETIMNDIHRKEKEKDESN